MLNASDIRIVFALVASLGIHGMLLGMDFGMQQDSSVRSPAKRVTFRLVSRQAEPSAKQVEETVKEAEPEIIRKVLPLPLTSEKKVEPEVTGKIKPLQHVPVSAKISRKSRIKSLVAEPKDDMVRETSLANRQPDEYVPKAEVTLESSQVSVPGQLVETDQTGILEVVKAKPLYRINPPPSYPAKARRRNLQGTVILEVSVSAEGRVNQLQIEESCGHRILDKAALAAVRKWVFEPGRRNGLPVSMTVLVPVRFALQ